MSKVIIRQYGVDDFSAELPEYIIGRRFVNFTISEPAMWAEHDPKDVVRSNVVELEFVGYEELGDETLPIYKVIGKISDKGADNGKD